MRRLLWGLAVGLLVARGVPAGAEDVPPERGGLRLVAAVEPGSVPSRDPFRIRAAFRNAGDRPLRVFQPEAHGPWPEWRLVRSDGATFAPTPFLGQTMWTEGIQGTVREIAPGAEVLVEDEVTSVCPVSADGRVDGYSPEALPPGTYAVTCAYAQADATVPFGLPRFEVRAEPVRGLWTGRLRSEPARLEVTAAREAHLAVAAPDGVPAGDPFPVEVTVVNPTDATVSLRGAFVVYVSSKMYGSAAARVRLGPDGPAPLGATETYDLVLPPGSSTAYPIDLSTLAYAPAGRPEGLARGLHEWIPEGHLFLQVTFVNASGSHVLQGNSPLRNLAERKTAPPGLALRLSRVEMALGGAVGVEARLVNEGAAPVRVPRRLAYPRDLAFDLTDAEGKRRSVRAVEGVAPVTFESLPHMDARAGLVVEGFAWDGERFEREAPLSAEDFVVLAPGESLRRTFDLASLLPGRRLPPAPLVLQAAWSNLEDGRRFGVGEPRAALGCLASEPLPLEVPAAGSAPR